MKNEIQTNSIGQIFFEAGLFCIKVDKEYRSGLTNIEGFSHLQIIWWGHLFDKVKDRKQLVISKPYNKSPESLGVFATRSQFRPNPILITSIFVERIDFEEVIIYTPYIDAEDGSPILDIKPYHMYERIEQCAVPNWCKHWPTSYEESANFEWEAEFNF